MKFKAAILLSFFFYSTTLFSQPFLVGHKQQTFVDASRGNRNITSEIYYPANVAGNNVALATGQFPVLVFGHGFVMSWSSYDNLWNGIVPNGYIMVFPTTETSFAPSHLDFGKDIAFLVGAMKNENLNSSSAFYNSVAPTSAVMGHSMGGGAAFLAVQFDSSITAIATLAAAVTNPSSTTASAFITIPGLVISGGNDCVAPAAQHQIPMYDSLASSCKSFVSIDGASHCQFANYNFFCSTGEATCSPQPTITATAQNSITLDALLPWLNFYLRNNCLAGDQFQNFISSGIGISSRQNCSLLCTNVSDNEVKNFYLSPNPITQNQSIKLSSNFINSTIEIYNSYGALIFRKNDFTGNEIQLDHDFGVGIYYLKTTGIDEKRYFGKFIIAE